MANLSLGQLKILLEVNNTVRVCAVRLFLHVAGAQVGLDLDSPLHVRCHLLRFSNRHQPEG